MSCRSSELICTSTAATSLKPRTPCNRLLRRRKLRTTIRIRLQIRTVNLSIVTVQGYHRQRRTRRIYRSIHPPLRLSPLCRVPGETLRLMGRMASQTQSGSAALSSRNISIRLLNVYGQSKKYHHLGNVPQFAFFTKKVLPTTLAIFVP